MYIVKKNFNTSESTVGKPELPPKSIMVLVVHYPPLQRVQVKHPLHGYGIQF